MSHREFSWEERKRLAAKGEALPSGAYPMPDCDAVRRAVHAYGRSDPSDRPKLRELIRRRNGELHCGIELDELEER